jgi:hypothetical protein
MLKALNIVCNTFSVTNPQSNLEPRVRRYATTLGFDVERLRRSTRILQAVCNGYAGCIGYSDRLLFQIATARSCSVALEQRVGRE